MSLSIYGRPNGFHIPEASDYRNNQTASSRYRYRRVVCEGNNSSLTAADTATQDVLYRFGASFVLNLGKSRLRIFEIINLGTVASTTQLMVRALPPIAAVRLQTSAGAILFDIQGFSEYMNICYNLVSRKRDVCTYASQMQGVPMTRVKTVIRNSPYYCGPYSSITDSSASPASVQGMYPMPATSTAGLSIPPHMGIWNLAAAESKTGGQFASTAGGPLIMPADLHPTNIDVVARGVPRTWQFAQGPVVAANAYVSMNGTTGSSSFCAPQGLPMQYISTGRIISASTALAFQWDMELRHLFPHTVCALTQDLFFGTDLMLSLSFASINSRAYQCVRDTHTGGGCNMPITEHMAHQGVWVLDAVGPVITADAAATLEVSATNAILSGEISGADAVSSVATFANASTTWTYAHDLLLAIQDNTDLVNTLKMAVASRGLRLPVQQPFIAKETYAPDFASASQTVSRIVRLNSARGAALLRAYVGWLMTRRSTTTVQWFDNIASNDRQSVWQTYRPFLNSVSSTDGPMNSHDQWIRQREVHRNTDSICDTYEKWLVASGTCIEDFTSGFDLVAATPEGGLPLANPIELQFDWNIAQHSTNPASGAVSFFFGVMLKYLSVNQQTGVQLESV